MNKIQKTENISIKLKQNLLRFTTYKKYENKRQ